MDLWMFIRNVPDFPKPGIGFKDITPLLADPAAFAAAIEGLAALCPPDNWDIAVGIEARGFLFGAALALHCGRGFAPARKPGKLPWRTVERRYALEYGEDALQLHADALRPGQRALLVDDLLATGGTLLAAAGLVRDLGARPVAAVCLLELAFLGGRARIEAADLPLHSLLCCTSEDGPR
jgi:adenine phosphoribosyltransferase